MKVYGGLYCLLKKNVVHVSIWGCCLVNEAQYFNMKFILYCEYSSNPINLTNKMFILTRSCHIQNAFFLGLNENCTCYLLTKQCNLVFFDKQLSTKVALAEECKDTQKSGEHFFS